MRSVPETMALLDRLVLVAVSVLIGVALASHGRTMFFFEQIAPGEIISAIVALIFIFVSLRMHRGGERVVENNTAAMNNVAQQMQALNGKLDVIEKTTDKTRDELESHRREFAAALSVKK